MDEISAACERRPAVLLRSLCKSYQLRIVTLALGPRPSGRIEQTLAFNRGSPNSLHRWTAMQCGASFSAAMRRDACDTAHNPQLPVTGGSCADPRRGGDRLMVVWSYLGNTTDIATSAVNMHLAL